MTILDGFKPFDFSVGAPYASITANGVTFNKSVVAKLGFPEFVLLLIDEEGQRIAIMPCDANTPNAVAFFRERKSGTISVRWNSKDLLNVLQELMCVDLSTGGFRVEGKYLRAENAMLFELLTAKPLS